MSLTSNESSEIKPRTVRSNEIKPRTVYLLRRTDKKDDGKDTYVGSTSKNLKYRLSSHRCSANYLWKYGNTKLYKKMREVGTINWEIVPLLTFSCDKKTILEFEREWCNLLNADLNSYSPSGFNKKEYFVNYRKLNKEKIKKRHADYYVLNKETIQEQQYEHRKLDKQNKVHHCDVCEKSFETNCL